MFRKIKTALLSLSALLILSMPAVIVTGTAVAQQTNQDEINRCLREGSNLVLDDSGRCVPSPRSDTTSGGNTLTTFVARVLNLLSVIVGIVAVVMIIVGGFRYVASAGKAESVQGAKNTILYALIGLVIVALAQVVVRFVLQRTTT